IDPDRLQVSLTLANRLAKEFNAAPEFHVTTDRREALANADYVINMIQVGSPEQIAADHTIPTRYGVRQTIGDTIGIGGIMRGLRTIPVVLYIARYIEELCPDAMLINYSHPMVRLVWSLEQSTSLRHVGLCHSVFNTAHELAHILDIPADEIDYLCA